MAKKQQKKISQGGGHQKVTSFLRGVIEKWPQVTRGKGGLKNLKMEVTSFMDGPLQEIHKNRNKVVLAVFLHNTMQ